MQHRLRTLRTMTETTLRDDGSVHLTIHRDGILVLDLTVAAEKELPVTKEESVTVTIAKHPGNLIIEG